MFEVVDEEEAREQLYKDIGYVENAELKIPKEVKNGKREGQGVEGGGGREKGRAEGG